MDEPVALLIAIPAIALALWALAFYGAHANSEARTIVAAELAAVAASGAAGGEAAHSVEGIATGATWPACDATSADLDHAAPGAAAAVTIVCDVPGPIANRRVCVTGYAQTRPAATGHVHTTCPAPGP